MKKLSKPALTLELKVSNGETAVKGKTRTALRPTVQAALTISATEPSAFRDLPLTDFVDELEAQSKAIAAGDMARPEAMLAAHAHTLDALFHRLIRQGLLNVGQYGEAAESYIRLGLKAQAQARATLDTLHEMKYPKAVAFVQQANIAHGHQQVNNGAAQLDSFASRGIEDTDISTVFAK